VTIDRERLLKFLRLTESDADGEALAALRMANKLIRGAGKSWDDILGSTTRSAPDYRTPPSKRGTKQYGTRAPRPDNARKNEKVIDESIDHMLHQLGQKRHDVSTLMFLAGLRDYFERNGYLTREQFEALERMYERDTGPQVRGGGWRF
jgi:hypothetical protein